MAGLLNGSGTQYEFRPEKKHPGNPLKKLLHHPPDVKAETHRKSRPLNERVSQLEAS